MSSGRRHITVYFGPGESRGLDDRPPGLTRSGWIVDIVRAYLAADEVMSELAGRVERSQEKLSVSLPEDLAAGLEVRHPGVALAELVRALVLRADPGTGAERPKEAHQEPVVLRVPLSDGATWSRDPEYATRVALTAIRRSASGVEPEPMVEIRVPPDLVQVLDRVRGTVSREAMVSQWLERFRMDAVIRAQRGSQGNVRTQVVDPRPFVPWLLQCTADGVWPPECILLAGEAGSDLLDEIVRRLRAERAEIVVVARDLELAPDEVDLVQTVHALVVQAVQGTGRTALVRLAPVSFPDGQLWLVAQISPS